MSNFTDEQRRVIDTVSGNLVVTASAGSGKTSVMTERFINLVLNGKTSVDRILCVTFTRLASEELKSRLARALRKAMAEMTDHAEIKRLKGELEKLPSASVSTVHSFCNTLVRKYFYAVNADPQFDVIDEPTAVKLKRDCIDELFEELYDSGDEGIGLLLKTFARRRSDRTLKDEILSLSEFISSEADGSSYMEKSLAMYSPEGVEMAVNGLIERFIKKINVLNSAFETLLDDSLRLGIDKYVAFLNVVIGEIGNVIKSRTKEAVLVFSSAKRTKPSVTTKDDPIKNEVSVQLGAVLEQLKKTTSKYYGILSEPFMTERATESGKVLAALFSVVKRFDEKYASAKRDLSVLDYSDLEHFAYKALSSDEILADVKKDIDYVFVDEYQDTNGIQEAIFSRIADKNLFIVGDAKQSIYGFRGCDSSIFEQRVAGATEEELVNLDVNFRSTKKVVDAVNSVFSAVMTQEVAGVDYAAHPMIYGGLYGGTDGKAVIVKAGKNEKRASDLPEGVYGIRKHLALLKRSEGGREEKAVRKIIESVYGISYEYTDRDGVKKKTIGFGDIAVLTRKGKGFMDRLVNELVSCGIPVAADSKRSIGAYPEIKLLVNILEVVEYGGKEDFSLVAALRSPVGGMTDEQLLAVRRAFGDGSYYEAVNNYRAGRIDDVSVKLNDFFDYIGKLRLISAYESAAEVLERVVRDKKLDTYLLASPFGDIKIKRLERFISAAENGGKGLDVTKFLAAKDAVLEKMTISFADGENAVRIMDMHQSKGLEFPVVILSELSSDYFRMDRRKEITLSRKCGVGLKYYDYKTKTVYPTVVKSYIDELKGGDTLREEMRLFYVAMTRAKYALYMVTTDEIADTRLGFEAEAAKKNADLLCKADCDFIDLSDYDDAPIPKSEIRPVIFGNAADGATVTKIERFLNFSYPHADDVSLSVKRTVTEIARSTAEKEEDIEPISPLFSSETTEKGNAYHKFLQLSSLKPDLVDEDLNRLLSSGSLSKEERALLDGEELKSILSCPIFTMLDGYELYREQPFIAYVPARIAGEKGETEVLVQGVIDLIAVRGDEAVIVDYKYSGKDGKRLISTYEKQLELYAYAAEKVLKLKVTAEYLFNIKSRELIKTK